MQAGGAGWSWEGAKAWGRERWGAWRVLPHEWWGSTQQAAEDLQQRLSWESFEAWQERHWAAFEERQRARLASLTDEQRAKWRHRLDEGEELVKREIGAFERWQQDWWARHHKEEVGAAAGAHGGRGKPTCPQCTLTYLFLPLLPHIGDSVSQCGLRLKVAAHCARAVLLLCHAAACLGFVPAPHQPGSSSPFDTLLTPRPCLPSPSSLRAACNRGRDAGHGHQDCRHPDGRRGEAGHGRQEGGLRGAGPAPRGATCTAMPERASTRSTQQHFFAHETLFFSAGIAEGVCLMQ